MKRLLITGASGFLGSNLALQFQRDGWETWGSYHGQPAILAGVQIRPLDVCLPDSIQRILDEAKPEAVIHAAAMAAPDDCAADIPATRQINVQGPKLLAAACAQRGIRFVFISTDLVFNGEKPFQGEEDPTQPLGVYGRSKADAEKEIRAFPGADPLVARLPLLYGWGRGPSKGRNFAEKWLRVLLTGGKVQAFTDQWRTPLYVGDAAPALKLCLEKGLSGTVHIAGPDRVSRHALGIKLAQAFSLPIEGILASSVNDVVYRDPRPADVSLSIERLKQATGFTPRGVAEGIEEMHQDLLRQA